MANESFGLLHEAAHGLASLRERKKRRDVSRLVEQALAEGTPRTTPVADIVGMTPIPSAVHVIEIPAELRVAAPTARYTYATLLGFCDADGIVRATEERLSEATGQSVATIRGALQALAAVGLVEINAGALRCLLRVI